MGAKLGEEVRDAAAEPIEGALVAAPGATTSLEHGACCGASGGVPSAFASSPNSRMRELRREATLDRSLTLKGAPPSKGDWLSPAADAEAGALELEALKPEATPAISGLVELADSAVVLE